MFGTKVEIVMKKAEPGSWSRLGSEVLDEQLSSPKPAAPVTLTAASTTAVNGTASTAVNGTASLAVNDTASSAVDETAEVDVLDLDDLELSSGGKYELSPEARGFNSSSNNQAAAQNEL